MIPRLPARGAPQAGATLVLSLLLLALMGLGASAAMRSSNSSQRASDNFQRELAAHQYAEAGLRYCEAQMLLAPSSRPNALSAIDSSTAATVSTWDQASTWSSSRVVSVPAAQFASSSASTYTTVTPPQCLVEKFALPDGSDALRVTARGFSPGYSADTQGRTLSGSVVWLQSILIIH
jgi:type IV pilus assembly protein PilX